MERVSPEGEVLTGSVPKSLLKKMAKAGLISSAVFMFFDAAPANAQDDRLKLFGIPEASIAPLALKLFGTENTNDLTPEQFEKVLKEYQKQKEAEEKTKTDKERKDKRALDSADNLADSSCFYHGTCPPN